MRKKSSQREWLENSYRQKAEEVNEILKEKGMEEINWQI